MFATVGMRAALHQRARLMIVTALIALSMIVGIAGATTQVGASAWVLQPRVQCDHYSQWEWQLLEGEDPGPGGMCDCYYWYQCPDCDWTDINVP